MNEEHAAQALHMSKRSKDIFYLVKLARIASSSLVLLSFLINARAQTPKAQSELSFRSSDRRLVSAFNWAKHQALAYVNDGDPVGPWYEAALPGRHAFCMRDVSHQVAGAQALGLSRYTHNMLRHFAEGISESRDWCSYWEIDRQNRPAPIDYLNDHVFWYNLPANFDLLDACYRMYLWTGDSSYIDDPAFLNFYRHTVTDYVLKWNLDLAHIMTRQTGPQEPRYFRGDPSYEESRRDIAVGADLLAAQYAAYRSFAAMVAIRGDRNTAQHYLEEAEEVKSLINTQWWNPSDNSFYGFLDNKHQFSGRASSDLLYWNAVDPGPKTKSSLDTLLKKMRTEPDSEVETESHYAEILYRYGQPDAAYAQILDLSRAGRKRREYPEVSYSVVGAIVNGLMGINVEPSTSLEMLADGQKFAIIVRTLPQLTASTLSAEVRNLPVGHGLIDVRHDRNRETVLTNHGDDAIDWEAAFPGEYAKLVVNERPEPAHTGRTSFDTPVTWIRLQVQSRVRMRVAVPK